MVSFGRGQGVGEGSRLGEVLTEGRAKEVSAEGRWQRVEGRGEAIRRGKFWAKGRGQGRCSRVRKPWQRADGNGQRRR